MGNRTRYLARRLRKRKQQRKQAAKKCAWTQEQAQQDYEAFKAWIASGEASKPITPEELSKMLLVASRIQ